MSELVRFLVVTVGGFVLGLVSGASIACFYGKCIICGRTWTRYEDKDQSA